MKTAVIITVGSELTGGRVTDTNTAWLASDLRQRGLRIGLALTVPDSTAAIGGALATAFDMRPDLIIVIGGLGPTGDDITAPAVAGFFGVEVRLDPEAALMVSKATGSSPLTHFQQKQAMLPEGSIPLKPAGTAPGFLMVAKDGRPPLTVLPGVPSEMRKMWRDAASDPSLAGVLEKADGLRVRTLCFYGIGEPAVGEAVDAVFTRTPEGPEVSICARYGEITLDVTYEDKDKDQVEELMSNLTREHSAFIYSEGRPVEEVIAALLAGRGATLAVAESCTGGMLGEVITGVSGSSKFFRGGVISYDDEIKKTLLGVSAEALEREGAVSETVAGQMASGARSACGAEYGIGITGIAGPTGGTPEKPVGMVCIAVSSEGREEVRTFDFSGGRKDVRCASVTAALHMLHGIL